MRRFSDRLTRLFAAAAIGWLAGCAGPAAPPPVAVLLPPPVEAAGDPRLVVLMLTDNVDHVAGGTSGSIAKGVSGNAEKMKAFFHQVEAATAMKLDLYEIAATQPAHSAGDPWDCTNIGVQIRTLPVRAIDTVVVYYSGHGTNVGEEPGVLASIAPAEFRNTRPTAFPFLYCGDPNGPFPNLDMVATWVQPKHPRLTVVIADACNSNLPGSGPAPTGLAAAGLVQVANPTQLRKLFRDASGTVLVGASEGNNYAFYETAGSHPMGFFTRQLLAILQNSYVPTQVDWDYVGRQFTKINNIRATDPTDGQVKTFTQIPFLRVGPPFSSVRTASVEPPPLAAATGGKILLAAGPVLADRMETPSNIPRLRLHTPTSLLDPSAGSAAQLWRSDSNMFGGGTEAGGGHGPLPVPKSPGASALSVQ